MPTSVPHEQWSSLTTELEQLTGAALPALMPEQQDWSALRTAVAQQVNWLIVNDLNSLIQLLYRVDISEPRLKFLLQEKVGEDASYIIADLLIERQLQKIKTREAFKNNPPPFENDDEERW